MVFVSTMQPIHLAIGFIEGLITAMVLLFVYEARPQMLQGIEETTSTYIESKCSIRKVITVFGIITLFTGGIFSLFASVYPDGLEWSIERISGSSEIETVNNHIYIILENIQKATAILADYGFKGTESVFGTSFSGIIGSLAVLGICLIACFAFRYIRRKKKTNMSKLDGALCDIHHIDISVEKNQWLNHMYPLIKLVVTMCFIIITVSFSKYDLVGILRMGVYPIVVFVLGEISFRDALKRIG